MNYFNFRVNIFLKMLTRCRTQRCFYTYGYHRIKIAVSKETAIFCIKLNQDTIYCEFYFVKASCTATATATVAPTIGLLPGRNGCYHLFQNVLKEPNLSYRNAVFCKHSSSICFNLYFIVLINILLKCGHSVDTEAKSTLWCP